MQHNSNITNFNKSTKQHECLIFKAWIDSGIALTLRLKMDKYWRNSFTQTTDSNLYAEIIKL